MKGWLFVSMERRACVLIRLVGEGRQLQKKQGCRETTLFDFAKRSAEGFQSYEITTTLAACKPFGPFSIENSTFCSASSFL